MYLLDDDYLAGSHVGRGGWRMFEFPASQPTRGSDGQSHVLLPHWYESMSRTPIRDALKWLSSAPANPSIRHSREGGNPRANIPRKKANRDTITCVQTATPLRLSGKNRPEPRYGAGIQVRWRGGKNDTQTIPGDGHPLSILRVPVATRMSDCYESMSWTPIRDRPIRDRRSAPVSSFQRRLESRRGGAHGTHFHTLVCRPLPAGAIGTKACPGLRSGMTLPALDRDFETHQSPQSSFPRRETFA